MPLYISDEVTVPHIFRQAGFPRFQPAAPQTGTGEGRIIWGFSSDTVDNLTGDENNIFAHPAHAALARTAYFEEIVCIIGKCGQALVIPQMSTCGALYNSA